MPRKKAQRRPNGAGTVYWSSSHDRYVGAVGTPRRYVYGPRGDRSATAELATNEKMAALRARKTSAEGRTRLGDFAEEWLKGADYLRNNTRATYEWALAYLLSSPLARMRLEDISRTDIRHFFNTLAPLPSKPKKDGRPRKTPTAVGAATKLKIRVFLHRVLEEAFNLEIIDRNPADKFRLPEPDRQIAVWEPEEALHFLREARGDRLYAMYLLALTTTMGPAELFGLRKVDVNLKGGYLMVVQNLEDVAGRVAVGATKTRSRRRRIDLPPQAIDALRDHLKANLSSGPFVFTSAEGQPLRRSNLRRREWLPLLKRAATSAEKAAAEAGNPDYRFPLIRFYDMRHTCNALMGYLGVPIEVARERMGHSSITTTVDVYGHIYRGQQDIVARKFGEFLDAL